MRASRASASLAFMTSPRDDLSERLPPGILSDLGRWTGYQSYRAFTWPWLVRRGILFWPIAVLAGIAYATWHSSGMGAWQDWPGLALRACFGALVAVTAGPLLATAVRHLRPPPATERLLVVLAVLAGLGIGLAALDFAADYHGALMQIRSGGAMNVGFLGRAMSRFFQSSIDNSVIALLLGGGTLALIYYFGEGRRIAQHAAQTQVSRLRAERDAAEMRLAVLQAQVEPHFLFNTLASVRSLIATEPERAARTIEALGDYLRATLPRLRDARPAESTLGDQIDLCAGYLRLMNVRMAGRIHVRIEASGAARALPFPPLVLLTLVENAVTHGIEPKVGEGAIAIVAEEEEGMLTVRVEDDGVGLETGVSGGLGLANVRAQLASLYGDSASLDIASLAGGGVRARIRVPAA